MAFTATGGPGPIPYIAPPTTAGQMFQAVKLDLSGGVSQFFDWVSANLDDDNNIAYNHRAYATSLSAALLAYMETSAGAAPPGLGLSTSAANAKLTELLSLAAIQPG